MDFTCCFDCRFFVPLGEQFNDLTDEEWADCLEGECRAGLPVIVQLLCDCDGDEDDCLRKWPKVLAVDWCGQFKPRKQTEPKHATIA